MNILANISNNMPFTKITGYLQNKLVNQIKQSGGLADNVFFIKAFCVTLLFLLLSLHVVVILLSIIGDGFLFKFLLLTLPLAAMLTLYDLAVDMLPIVQGQKLKRISSLNTTKMNKETTKETKW